MTPRAFKLSVIGIGLIILMLVCISVHATDLTVKCTAPTTNADGTPISSSATIGFNVYGGMQGTNPLPLLTNPPLSTCSRTATNVNIGVVCYAVSAVETINGVSSESAQTTPICTTVPPPTPSAPGGATVTVSVPGTANTIYILEKATDSLVLVPAGTVPAGTACDATQAIVNKGSIYDLVPRSAVTWSGNVKSLTAFAKCS